MYTTKKGKRIHDPRLVELIINQDGDLVIRKWGRHAQDFADISKMPLTDDSKLGEALEYYTCNGWGYSTDASYFGHLSNAPIVWDGNNVEEDENGEEYPTVFWYDDMYAIRSAWEELVNSGSVTFSYFDARGEEKTS